MRRWMELARRRDERRLARAGDGVIPIGVLASAWAILKFVAITATAPGWVPLVLARAAINHRRARRDLRSFPVAMSAIAHRRTPRLRADTVLDVSARSRLVVFSDLHRCVPGRLDWPKRQGTDALYRDVLKHYLDDGWTLCENGDVEDFWMVGGSTLGAVYDAGRLLGGATARRDTSLLETVYRGWLAAILGNNAPTYDLLARFVAEGRYLRTIGNHDDPLRRPAVAELLHERLGRFPIGDLVALRHADGPGNRPGGDLAALVVHGHHTDAWNAPHADLIGKFATWFGCTVVDVPGLSIPEGLPPESATLELLESGPRDRLVELDPLIGATTDYDSLDEELLFAAVRDAGFDDRWLVLGHTHIPLDGPRSKRGGRWRGYVNGGSGIFDRLITGVEWDGTAADPRPRLVAWRTGAGGAERLELPIGRERRGEPTD